MSEVTVAKFGRFKQAEEFAQRLTRDKVIWTMRVEYDVVHIEPGEEDEPYVYHDFIMEYSPDESR